MNEFWLYVWVCLGAVFAGFIDAVTGGGGLTQVPLLMILFPELSHVQIIATNRFASLAGTAVAAFQYWRSVGVDATMVLVTGTAAAISSFSGTFVMRLVPPDVFKPVLLLIIALLAVYSFVKKDLGALHQPRFEGKRLLFTAAGLGVGIGFYNGFIGPGTGTLLVFAFVSVLGMNFLKASAHAKVINAIADGASLVGFLFSNSVVYKWALPMMLSNMLGGYLGSKAAILRGNRFIRYVFLVVLVMLLLRLGWDVFFEF